MATNRIRAVRKAHKATLQSVSDATGLSVSYLSRLESGEREVDLAHVRSIATALGVTASELIDGDTDTVAIMGFVGAGAEISPEYDQVPPEGLYEVKLVIGVPKDLIGFEVRGDSMLPRFREGDVILAYREPRRGLAEYVGHEAVVRTSDGRRFVKNILRGPTPGTVTLDSHNARAIEGVTLEWVGEIALIVPKTVLKQMERAEKAASTRRTKARSAETAGMDELPLAGREVG